MSPRPITLWLVAVVITATLVAPSAALSAEAPPCAACVTLSVGADQLRRLVDTGIPTDAPELIVPSDVPLDVLRTAIGRGARIWLAGQLSTDVSIVEDADIAGVVFALSGTPSDLDQTAFAIKKASSLVRGSHPSARVGIRASVATLRDLAPRGVAPYLEVVVVTDTTGGATELAAIFPSVERWREASSESTDPVEALVAATSGTSERVVLSHPDPVRLAMAAAALSNAMPPGLTSLPEVSLQCEGCRADVWLHPETLDAIALIRAPSPIQSFTVHPAASTVRIANVERGTMEQASTAAAENSSAGVRVTVSPHLSTPTMVVQTAGWRGVDETVYREEVKVSAERKLTVEEILARHQAQRARQAALVRSVISSGTTVLTFDVPGFAGPVTIGAATTIFTRGALTEIAQRDIRVNGVALSSDGRAPKLPLIEPERVSTPPLSITLTAAYRYRLAGRERCGDGRDCYVVEFSPSGERETAFSGRAWIDTVSFGLVRRVARQTNLSGAIVSNQQVDDFSLVEVADRPVWLQRRSASFQVYQAAGFRTPIHRVIETPDQDVNLEDFEGRRAGTHASEAVMLRDTAEGLKYLVPGQDGRVPGARVLSTRAGRRVVTLAFGVLVDPNITVPLPYAGVSYLDFDFLKTGAQFSGFFGGSYGQLAWAVPRFIRSGWQLTGQAFGIGVSYNDRSFRDGRERYDENIRQRPLRFDATVVAPIAPQVQLRLGYEFEYTAFSRGDDTADTFMLPTDAVVHAARVALDVQRGPWSGLVWWNPARRAGWRRWGRPEDPFTQGEEDFQRYGGTLGRSWVVSPGTVVRVDGTWMDGDQLDRFSRYSFDGFANRLRGYPSASIRYDRGGILRSVATWTPAPQFRLDAFADYAAVHDPGFGRGLRSYPGLGAAVEVPLPRQILIAVEWGYGFEARNTDGSRGTHVVKVSGFKIF